MILHVISLVVYHVQNHFLTCHYALAAAHERKN